MEVKIGGGEGYTNLLQFDSQICKLVKYINLQTVINFNKNVLTQVLVIKVLVCYHF